MLDTKVKVFHESISRFMKWPWNCISWNALKEKFHSVSFPLQMFFMAASKTWTQILDLGPGPGPRKTWTLNMCILKNLEPEKPGPWKTWTMKNMDSEKLGTMENVGNSWIQKKDKKTTEYNLLALKRLVSKPSQKIDIEAF